jgi:hemolysin III
MLSKFREPVSGLTHLFGSLISIVGLIVLIIYANLNSNLSVLSLIAILIFGISMFLLYSASSIYHLVKSSEKVIFFLRKLDHSMIFVLIAGTYTPICLITLDGNLRWIFFIVIWSLAALGILFKMLWFNAPRWLSTLFYILMGWLSIFLISPISSKIASGGIVWLALGGVVYTLGGIIYATKWPKIQSHLFGFHEIFHLFVLGGTFCHYWMILNYVI